jgi:hypothetical protein
MILATQHDEEARIYWPSHTNVSTEEPPGCWSYACLLWCDAMQCAKSDLSEDDK